MKSARASNTIRPPICRKKNITTAAHSLTVEFLGSLPRIREMLQTDMEAAYDGDPAAKSKEEVLVSYPFIEAIAVQRLAHELYLKDVALIPRIMTEWAHAARAWTCIRARKSGRTFSWTIAPARSSAKPPSSATT